MMTDFGAISWEISNFAQNIRSLFFLCYYNWLYLHFFLWQAKGKGAKLFYKINCKLIQMRSILNKLKLITNAIRQNFTKKIIKVNSMKAMLHAIYNRVQIYKGKGIFKSKLPLTEQKIINKQSKSSFRGYKHMTDFGFHFLHRPVTRIHWILDKIIRFLSFFALKGRTFEDQLPFYLIAHVHMSKC